MSSDKRNIKRIVIVDDEPGVIDLITAMLAGVTGDDDLDIQIADTCEQAVDMCRLSPPDVLLLDIRMPGMDGFEACRLLKADPRTAEVRVVMVTAFAQEAHRRRSFAAGANYFLTKPFTTLDLVEALTQAA